jgi:hypothetical protein
MARIIQRLIIAFLVATAITIWLLLTIKPPLLLTHINQLSIAVEQRIQFGDLKPTDEEAFCRSAHELTNPTSSSATPIPNTVHFILLADNGAKVELKYSRFLAIKPAVLRSGAEEVKLHT